MAKTKYVNSTQLQKELFKRTEGYAANVRAIYQNYLLQIINLVKGTELEEGKPFSFSEYGYSDEATAIFREMYSRLYQEIRNDVQNEWLLSNQHNDELVKSVFGENSINDNHFARFFKRNMEAMDAFFARKTGEEGLSLSQKVWRYTGQFKEELENCLDLAIGEGTGANKLASKIQTYLQDPDRFYRRFRIKVGEDENGNTVYGRVSVSYTHLDVYKRQEEQEGNEKEEGSEDDPIADEKEDFYRSMLNDCLYESNNEFDIPNLLLEEQAGKLLLPFAPWGADSRLRKDVATYHFYVDDYRFEAIWKDPIKVLTSGVKALVEPNLSVYDTTPIAYGLQQIYKKRWISRYFQECGIKVYADLNVSVKFKEYNKLGLPKAVSYTHLDVYKRQTESSAK